jgi:hypothetical protein
MNVGMASSTIPLILGALPCWIHLTCLRIRVWLNSSTEVPTHCFPDLSFLATTIWKCCLNLQTLEYHSDTSCILGQDLSEPLKVCGMSCASPSAKDRKEPRSLSYLNINIGSNVAQASTIEVPLARKVAIAVFLDRLFPRFKTIEGSAAALWSEIALVKSYQAQRERLWGQWGSSSIALLLLEKWECLLRP